MPITEINSFKDFEFCLTPDNPAIRQARKLINRLSVPRVENEDYEYEHAMSDICTPKRNKEFHICQNCARRGDRTKYLKSEMMEIPRKVIRNNRTVILRFYLCPKHAAGYKPQSERVGCHTF